MRGLMFYGILLLALVATAAAQPAPAAADAPAAGAAMPAADAAAPAPAVQALMVERAALTAEGAMIEVRFALPPSNTARFLPLEDSQTFLVDEASGKKYFVVRMGVLGPLGQKRIPKGSGKGYFMIDNRFKTLQAGATVTVVVAGLKQEHVTVTQ
jgi:hypothetical protein